MKKKLSIALILIGLTLIVIGLYLDYQSRLTTAINKNPDTVQNIDNDEISKINELLTYSGIYTNNNITFTLRMSSADCIDLLYAIDTHMYMLSLELDNNSLTYDGSYGFDDEDIDLSITKDSSGINVISSSTDPTSGYNQINGHYSKQEFTSNNWSGYYINGDTKLILDEYKEDCVEFSIQKDYSYYSRSLENITNSAINYEDTFLDEQEVITIEKNSDNTITVTAFSSSTDSLLNDISGTYTKY